MISKEFSQTLTLLNALSKGISGNFKNEKASVKITKNVGKGFKFFVQQSGFHTVQDFSPLENQKIKTRKFGELLA